MVINLDRNHPAKSNSYVRKKLGLPPIQEEVIMDENKKPEETTGEKEEEDKKEPEDAMELSDEKEKETPDEKSE